jgi:peptidoglycan/LPS O-acetylase OafA/YrhL
MEAKSRRTSESRRTTAAVAIALVAATVTAGVAFGHHPKAETSRSVAAVVPAPAAAAVLAHDPSLPDAAELHADPRATAEDSTPTF